MSSRGAFIFRRNFIVFRSRDEIEGNLIFLFPEAIDTGRGTPYPRNQVPFWCTGEKRRPPYLGKSLLISSHIAGESLGNSSPSSETAPNGGASAQPQSPEDVVLDNDHRREEDRARRQGQDRHEPVTLIRLRRWPRRHCHQRRTRRSHGHGEGLQLTLRGR